MEKIKLEFLKPWRAYGKGDRVTPSDAGVTMNEAEQMERQKIVKILKVRS